MSQIQGLIKRLSTAGSKLAESTDESEEATQALNELRAASYELHQATLSPTDWLTTFSFRMVEIGTVQSLMNTGVVQAIPPDSRISYEQLAQDVSIDQDVLERLCRYSIAFGFFEERAAGYIEHSPSSRKAAEHFAANRLAMNLVTSAATKIHPALLLDPSAAEPNASAMSVSTQRKDGSYPAFWEFLAENDERHREFAALMQFTGSAGHLGIGSLATAFDWKALKKGSTVVDVGGGKGHIMMDLAKSFPDLRFVVQDRAEVIQAATNGHSSDDSANERIEFMSHDFFNPQPVHADVFFLRKILHDWSDKYAKQIISSLIPAMRPGTKLLINDIVLPEPSGQLNYHEALSRRSDLMMMCIANGKERSLEQFKTLVSSAEPSLRFEGVSTVGKDSAMMSVLEFSFG